MSRRRYLAARVAGVEKRSELKDCVLDSLGGRCAVEISGPCQAVPTTRALRKPSQMGVPRPTAKAVPVSIPIPVVEEVMIAEASFVFEWWSGKDAKVSKVEF